jgi:thiol:disulfide interchange protein
MVLYVGLAGSPLVGATLLFLFSLGMGIPLVIGAMAMARVLPMLFKVEKSILWMGLGSAILIAGYAVILITGNFMAISSFFIRLAGMESGYF